MREQSARCEATLREGVSSDQCELDVGHSGKHSTGVGHCFTEWEDGFYLCPKGCDHCDGYCLYESGHRGECRCSVHRNQVTPMKERGSQPWKPRNAAIFSLTRGNFRITAKARGRRGLELRSVEKKQHDMHGMPGWRRLSGAELRRFVERFAARMVIELGERVDVSAKRGRSW